MAVMLLLNIHVPQKPELWYLIEFLHQALVKAEVGCKGVAGPMMGPLLLRESLEIFAVFQGGVSGSKAWGAQTLR